MSETTDALQSALADELGSSLRVLGRHEGEDWGVEYSRDDLEDVYDASALDDIAGDLALSALEADRQEDRYEPGAVLPHTAGTKR